MRTAFVCLLALLLIGVTSCTNGQYPREEARPSPLSLAQTTEQSEGDPASEINDELSPADSQEATPPASQLEPQSSSPSEEQMNSSASDLLLEDAPLLLSDEGHLGMGGEGADNSRCFVCHLNYVTESLAVTHAKEGIGCADCHGESDEHIADESWASGGQGTPPDIMYRREEVIPSCLKCHELHKADPDCRCRFPWLEEKQPCTDCHGEHRLKVRKCVWK